MTYFSDASTIKYSNVAFKGSEPQIVLYHSSVYIGEYHWKSFGWKMSRPPWIVPQTSTEKNQTYVTILTRSIGDRRATQYLSYCYMTKFKDLETIVPALRFRNQLRLFGRHINNTIQPWLMITMEKMEANRFQCSRHPTR